MDTVSYEDLYFDYDLKENQVGDLARTGDKEQSIILRLQTPYGANIFHPEYGNRLYDILSDNIDDKWTAKAIAYETECIEQDATLTVVDIVTGINMLDRRVVFDIKYLDAENYGINSIKWGEELA